MDSLLLEVKAGVLHSPDGEAHNVEGGAYLSPEAYLITSAELERLRRRHAEATASSVPLVLAAALVGLAAGFWLGRRGDD